MAVFAGLTDYLKGGGRKIDAWYASLEVVEVPFDDEQAFANVNTPEDLALAEAGEPLPLERRAAGQRKHRGVKNGSESGSSESETLRAAPSKALGAIDNTVFGFLTSKPGYGALTGDFARVTVSPTSTSLVFLIFATK